MKKSFISILVIAISFFISASVVAGPVINITIKIGKRSCNCCGFGFCFIRGNVTLNENMAVMDYRDAAGTISSENGKIIMTFSKESMNKETVNSFFGTPYFSVDEDYTIPDDLCKKLQIKSFTIKTGRYQIFETAKAYQVIF